MKLFEITLTAKKIRAGHHGPIIELIAKNWDKKEDIHRIGNLVFSKVDLKSTNRTYFIWDKDEYAKMIAITNEFEREIFDLEQLRFKQQLDKEGSVRLRALTHQLKQAKDIEINNSYIAGFLDLFKRSGWMGWSVSLTYLLPEYRNQGLAKKLYEAAIIKDEIILISGEIQTSNSKTLWHSFIKNRKFTVWAQDLHDLDVMAQVFWDESADDVAFSDVSKKGKAFDKVWYKEKELSWARRFEDARLIVIKRNGTLPK